MASDTVATAIEDFLTASWDFTALPIKFENEQFATPTDDHGQVAPFAALELIGNLYEQESIGESRQADNLWIEEGQAWLLVFVRIGTGNTACRRYAKQLADLFRGLTLLNGDLEFLGASIGMGQKSDDNGDYWGVPLSIDWRRWNA